MTLVPMVELIEDVRIAIDENAVQSSYILGNSDNLELDDVIYSKLIEAARDVTETAESKLLEPLVMNTTVSVRDGGGSLSLPDDFLRLVSLKMVGWNRSVSMVAEEGSDIELMQRNKYTRGTVIKPVCVFGHSEDGKRVIEYFGSGDIVEKALYMPIPKINVNEAGESLLISKLLRQAIVRRAAGLTLQSRGETEQAKVFLG